MMKKIIFEPGDNNEKLVEMTREEIAQLEKDQAEGAAELAEFLKKQEVKNAAIAKLKALGLTEDEVTALL